MNTFCSLGKDYVYRFTMCLLLSVFSVVACRYYQCAGCPVTCGACPVRSRAAWNSTDMCASPLPERGRWARWTARSPTCSAAGMPSTLLCTNARNSRLRPCFAEKTQIVTKNTQPRTVDCAPSNFVRSVLPFVTTTRGSSECRPDEKAEATSRFVALCGAKQKPQGFVAEPQKPVTTRAHSDGYQI